MADSMSDEEIKKLRDLQDRFADLLFDSWVESLEKKHRQKNKASPWI